MRISPIYQESPVMKVTGAWKLELKPLRNRTSAIHFFVAKILSIAQMTHTYVCHLRNLRPMIRLISYVHSE